MNNDQILVCICSAIAALWGLLTFIFGLAIAKRKYEKDFKQQNAKHAKEIYQLQKQVDVLKGNIKVYQITSDDAKNENLDFPNNNFNIKRKL